MRAWRTSEGFLVDEGRTATVVIQDQLDELPDDRWRELHDFALLDPYGIVRRRFTVTVSSLEDDLSMTVYAVLDGTFRSRTVTIHTGATWRVHQEEETILTALRPVLPDETEALELIREGLTCDTQLQLHRLEERRRAAKEIVARHPSAGDDDPRFKGVMDLVRGRVESRGLELDKLLLGLLAQTRALRLGVAASEHAATGALAAFAPAVDSILLACRRAAFDRALGRQDPPPAPVVGSFDRMSEPERNGIRMLAETLGELEVRLAAEAEGQENADAMNNAAEFRRAAIHLAQARKRLDDCLSR